MITGTIINAAAIITGGLIGVIINKGIPVRVSNIIFQALGLFSVFLGVSLAFKTQNNYLIIALALIIGGVTGELLQLERGTEKLSNRLRDKLKNANPKFTEGLVISSMLFSIGSMAIIGPLNEALDNDMTLVLTKSMMDGVTAIALAAAYGRGVLFSAVPVFIIQAGIGLGAKWLEPFLSDNLINELTAVGGVLIVGIGITVMEIKKIKVINLLPAMLFIIPLYLISCALENNQSTSASELPTKGMVVSAHPVASKIGYEILKNGGNAFDAAVGVQFALAVVYPRAGNIAGGGFAVFRESDGNCGTLDFREKAPNMAKRDMYLDDSSNVIEELSSFGHLSVGVPGTVDGMCRLHNKLGHLSFNEVIQPAINIARNGFILTEKEAKKLNAYQLAFIQANSEKIPFIRNSPWMEGDSIFLPKLAETLIAIRDRGREGFYDGKVSNSIIGQIEKGKGIITKKDLADYKSVWREPITGMYKGYKVITMSPPSSGGIALMQLLRGTCNYDIEGMGHNTSESIHVMTELERRVYADRATHLGDPEFVSVPIKMLLDSNYIASRNSSISLQNATSSDSIREGYVERIESMETTHFSIVDKNNNAIAITTTLNGNFGSKVFVKNGGFFLNNEMDDFSAKPNVPNQYGLVGAEANAIEPGKRMLSSMTPTIIEKDNRLFMVVGTPGGATIITSVYQSIINVIDHKMSIQEAINAKKVHHQWQPNLITYEENGLDSVAIKKLTKMGHTLKSTSSIGRVDAILVDENNKFHGAADPRGDDVAVGF
ncbi:MAG: gamma-glutamyltransferase [Crocinitomicaceae bacterium]|jgi:gamma-glutamyltranspeptidase/glutathione hydrolase|nr:gamma-glutamyltransferase [Crocinitomicaceae bacterium]